MPGFVGRHSELGTLRRHLDAVSASGAGRLVSVRGRRQVGKSRLVEEFLRTSGAPGAFFAAAQSAPRAEELRAFAAEVARSSLESADLFADVTFEGWEPALRLLASNTTTPSIVVIDELPYLLTGDAALEGALQRVWDRDLSRVPMLLVVVGSDLSIMELLGTYDRPLYQRMREMVVEPFTVAEIAEMLGLTAADAFDAYCVLGGFPTVAGAWGRSETLEGFLRAQLADPTSPLVVAGERILNAEFPAGLQAREVLRVVGAGETTFGTIASRAGLNQGSLTRTLRVLADDKRVIAVDRPLSGRATRNALYRVADPYLRFWLRFVGPNLELLLRGRGDVVADRTAAAWGAYRGKAVEPLVRASLERLLPDARLGLARHVGSYWTRAGDLEVDLVGGSDPRAPTAVSFVGSTKWRERAPFDRHDLAALAAGRSRVPGAEQARLVGVSRAGFDTADLDVAIGPGDLVAGQAGITEGESRQRR